MKLFVIFFDPSDKLHGSKHGLVVRPGQYVFENGEVRLQHLADQREVLGVYHSERDAEAALKLFEAKRSWLYIHRHRFGFWSLLAIALITIPWAHYVNNAPWIETPVWAGAVCLFFVSIAVLLIVVFWPSYTELQDLFTDAVTAAIVDL